MADQQASMGQTIKDIAAQPSLSPGYKAAQSDSRILIGFMGNMAIVSTLAMESVDPFQMLAASKYLEMKALQMIQSHELNEARKAQSQRAHGRKPGIITPGEFAQQTGRWADPQELKGKKDVG